MRRSMGRITIWHQCKYFHVDWLWKQSISSMSKWLATDYDNSKIILEQLEKDEWKKAR